jgi:hypothetical protein
MIVIIAATLHSFEALELGGCRVSVAQEVVLALGVDAGGSGLLVVEGGGCLTKKLVSC